MAKFQMMPIKMKFIGQIALSTRIPNIFDQEGPNFCGGTARNLVKWPKTGKPIVMQIRGGQF